MLPRWGGIDVKRSCEAVGHRFGVLLCPAQGWDLNDTFPAHLTECHLKRSGHGMRSGFHHRSLIAFGISRTFNIDAVDVLVGRRNWRSRCGTPGSTRGIHPSVDPWRLVGWDGQCRWCVLSGWNELTPWRRTLGCLPAELERREPEGLDHNWVSCFGYRPTTAEGVLQDWVRNEPRLSGGEVFVERGGEPRNPH